jgi:two-component system response regulator RegX3
MSEAHVLVIEDEESYRDSLVFLLGREGFRVTTAADGRAGLDAYARDGADIVLLDLMLPEMPGTEVFRRLREHSDVPVIMVTARGDEVDRIIGLELGADDYVTKPYSGRELVARIRNVLKRASGAGAGPAADAAESLRLSVAGLVLDPERLSLARGDEVQHLPPKEFQLLHLLARNAGRVLPRQVIIERVWGADYFGDTKTLDVHIKRIRARVEQDPANPVHIRTVRGVGYTFEP